MLGHAITCTIITISMYIMIFLMHNKLVAIKACNKEDGFPFSLMFSLMYIFVFMNTLEIAMLWVMYFSGESLY